jgi:tetratricopeptide (TPR) repeat protein
MHSLISRRYFSVLFTILIAQAAPARGATPASDAAYAEGQALMVGKHLPEAAQKFEAAVASDPGSAAAWYALAVVRRRLGECTSAIAAYRRYALLQPQKSEPYYGLGLCLRETGDKTAAVDALKRYVAMEKDPNSQKWVDNAREILGELGAQEAPASTAATSATTAQGEGGKGGVADKAEAEKPGPGELTEARTLRDRGHIDEAIGKYQQAIQADPKRLAVRTALGELLLQVHRDDEAIDVFRATLERNPTYLQALYDLAFALRARDRQAEAVDAYQRYIKLRPSDPDAYYGLARALQKLGRKADAKKAYENYLALEKRPGERQWIASAQTQLRTLKGP